MVQLFVGKETGSSMLALQAALYESLQMQYSLLAPGCTSL